MRRSGASPKQFNAIRTAFARNERGCPVSDAPRKEPVIQQPPSHKADLHWPARTKAPTTSEKRYQQPCNHADRASRSVVRMSSPTEGLCRSGLRQTRRTQKVTATVIANGRPKRVR